MNYRVVHVADGEFEDGKEYISAQKPLDEIIAKRDEMKANDPELKVWIEDCNGQRVEL